MFPVRGFNHRPSTIDHRPSTLVCGRGGSLCRRECFRRCQPRWRGGGLVFCCRASRACHTRRACAGLPLGPSTSRIYAAKPCPAIAPLITRGAIHPGRLCVGPAMKVWGSHAPNGTFISRRSPVWAAQPRSCRVGFDGQSKSINTSRLGSTGIAGTWVARTNLVAPILHSAGIDPFTRGGARARIWPPGSRSVAHNAPAFAGGAWWRPRG